MIKKILLCAAGIFAVSATAASAGTTSGTAFTVQVTVTAGCSITTDVPSAGITFASTVATSPTPPADIGSSVTVTCTNTTPYQISFTSANTVTSNTERTMKSGASTIGYQILQGASKIGNTAATGFSATGNGAAQTTAIAFHIPSTGWTPVLTQGTYTDTVTLQVSY